MFLLAFSFILSPNFDSLSQGLAHAVVDDDGATPERRVCRFYAGGLYDVAGALQAPTLSLFLSREVGHSRSGWLFYTVNAIAGILVSLALAKRSDSQGDRRKLILFCCAMAVGNALLFAFNRHYLTLITCGVLLASGEHRHAAAVRAGPGICG
jgi:MFS-type transporter involved in bile tolerance (Atg22 family)